MTETTTRSAGTTTISAPATATKPRVGDGLRWLAIVVVIGFAIHQLATNWSEFLTTLDAISLRSAALAQLMVIGAIAATVSGWRVVVNGVGPPVGHLRCAQIYLVGQLGKYVPGSVWGYFLQVELGRKAGIARSRVFVASLLYLGVITVSAMVIGLLAIPAAGDVVPNSSWLLAIIPVGLVALHPRLLTWATSRVLCVLRRPALERGLSGAVVGKTVGMSGVAHLLQGVHLWLLVGSVDASGLAGLAVCVGVMALAMTAGTLAFVLPAGIGAREVALVALLVAAGAGHGEALAAAVVSRVMFVIADLVTAGGAAFMAQARLHPAMR